MRSGSGAVDGDVVLAVALSVFTKGVAVSTVEAVAASSRDGGVLFEDLTRYIEEQDNW